MGGKSRKTGKVSKGLIDKLKGMKKKKGTTGSSTTRNKTDEEDIANAKKTGFF